MGDIPETERDGPKPPALSALSEPDRALLKALVEQVAELTKQLAKLSLPVDVEAEEPKSAERSVFRFEDLGPPDRATRFEARAVRTTRPPLPEPRLVRQIIRNRQRRTRYFDGNLFADPAWDMLLDLTAAHAEHKRVSVTSLCIASGVPPTTALRWIAQLETAELLCRSEDGIDRRRAFITLTDKAANSMARYFSEIGKIGGGLRGL